MPYDSKGSIPKVQLSFQIQNKYEIWSTIKFGLRNSKKHAFPQSKSNMASNVPNIDICYVPCLWSCIFKQ